MQVTLHEATSAELAVVKNLAAYYLYDISKHTRWACSADGRFAGLNGIEKFWTQPGRHAFKLRSGQE